MTKIQIKSCKTNGCWCMDYSTGEFFSGYLVGTVYMATSITESGASIKVMKVEERESPRETEPRMVRAYTKEAR